MLPVTVKQIATVLSSALYDNPYFEDFMPNAARRRAQLEWWMTCITRYALAHGEVYVYQEGRLVRGTALWLGPEHPFPSIVHVAWAGLLWSPLLLGLANTWRALQRARAWRDVQQETVSPHHWYLMELGVAPEFREQGIGTALLLPILERANTEHLLCFLKTAFAHSREFFEHRGFEVVDTAFSGWAMRRLPQPLMVIANTSYVRRVTKQEARGGK